jgi:hypothetical protein
MCYYLAQQKPLFRVHMENKIGEEVKLFRMPLLQWETSSDFDHFTVLLNEIKEEVKSNFDYTFCTYYIDLM